MRGRTHLIRVAVLAVASVPLLLATSSQAQQPAWDPVVVARDYFANTPASAAPGIASTQSAAAPIVATSTDPDETQDVVDVRSTMGSVHVRLQQKVHGIPVAGGISNASMQPGDSSVNFAIDRRFAHTPAADTTPKISTQQAIDAAHAAAGVKTAAPGEPTTLAYVPEHGTLRLAWQVQTTSIDPIGAWQTMVDARTGAVISQNSALTFDSGQTFEPNPYQQSGGSPTLPANCDTAPNAALLTPFLRHTPLLGITAAQNRLKGQFVDLTAPGIVGAYKPAGVANEPTRVYNYPCNDDRFEEVMVYSFIDRTQRIIQSLGFTGSASILNSATPAHAHYFGGCNAFYSTFDKGLHFGDGDLTANTSSACSLPVPRPDGGEDGDVIVHEYGHALQADIVPGWGLSLSGGLDTEQANAMGEGWGDFVAATINGDSCIGGWGLFPGACLRNIDNTKVYPTDFESCRFTAGKPVEPHCAGLIWGGAMWDLVKSFGTNQAGRYKALTLGLASQFYVVYDASFNDWASAIRRADLDLYGGADVTAINAVFTARGITSTGTPTDRDYIFLRIRHPNPPDLTVSIKVGNVAAPDCNILAYSHGVFNGSDLIIRFTPSQVPSCPFPPSVAKPWHLEAQDTVFGNSGYIDSFETLFNTSTSRCVSTDTPVAIPDGGAIARANIDCSSTTAPPGVDADGDGVTFALDNCPNVSNADQLNTDSASIVTPGVVAIDKTAPNSDLLGDACDPDIDNDGLANSVEAAVGPAGAAHALCPGASANTDPLKLDTDGDGVTDGAECALGSDPANAASKPVLGGPDSDFDGLSDAFELTIGTDPANKDTDGDGVTDGVEYKGYGTSPLLADTDADGCSDSREIASIDANTSVSSSDLLVVAQSFGEPNRPNMDMNKNGVVNSADLLFVAQQFATSAC